jgi:hypothetical protein
MQFAEHALSLYQMSYLPMPGYFREVQIVSVFLAHIFRYTEEMYVQKTKKLISVPRYAVSGLRGNDWD